MYQILNELPLFQENRIFTEEEAKELSKYRIIQKNLVHFQGFPDHLYNEELLKSKKYFGQYGNIIKIILSKKTDSFNQKNKNSAYITFESKEQAAYAILAVDSIKIDKQLVRAFFGTTKYCNHFLNNYQCFSENKCNFLHYLADPNDVIKENDKYGYTDHIKLAKKIVAFDSYHSKCYIKNNKCPIKTKLPPIESIYSKEDISIKSKVIQRECSNFSENSTEASNEIDSYHKAKSKSSKSISDDENEKSPTTIINNFCSGLEHNNNNDNYLFSSKIKSRFFDNNNNQDYIDSDSFSRHFDYLRANDSNNNNYTKIIDNLLCRLSFFYEFNDYISFDELCLDYCTNLYNQTKDNEIREIIAKIF